MWPQWLSTKADRIYAIFEDLRTVKLMCVQFNSLADSKKLLIYIKPLWLKPKYQIPMAFFNELIDYIFMLFYPTNNGVGMKVRKAFTAGAQAALSQFFYEIRPIQYWSLCNPATKAFLQNNFFLAIASLPFLWRSQNKLYLRPFHKNQIWEIAIALSWSGATRNVRKCVLLKNVSFPLNPSLHLIILCRFWFQCAQT